MIRDNTYQDVMYHKDDMYHQGGIEYHLNTDDMIDSIVLSGGGLKGLAILGALEYCYNTIDLSMVKGYIGSSSGALICLLLCIGYMPREILSYLQSKMDIMKEIHRMTSIMHMEGIVPLSKVKCIIEEAIVSKLGYVPTLKELYDMTGKIYVSTCYNDTKQETEYVSYLVYPNLLCVDAVIMTISLPFIFPNVIYNGCLYMDGGIRDMFPVRYLITLGLTIPLGLNVIHPIQSPIKYDGASILFNLYKQLMYTQTDMNIYSYGLIVSIPIPDISFDSITDPITLNAYYDMGYKYILHSIDTSKLIKCKDTNNIQKYAGQEYI